MTEQEKIMTKGVLVGVCSSSREYDDAMRSLDELERLFDTAGGVLFAKFLNLFMKKKVNPMIGAAGISAFPMSSRVVHKMGLQEDPSNFLLMHAAGANVSGQIASVIAGGLLLALVGG